MQASQLVDGERERDLVLEHNTSITAEYEMKADQIAHGPGDYDFTASDRIVDFAETNGLQVRGHALLWYRTTPDFFLTGTRDEIRTKLQDYITAVVSRYRGRVQVWDVVNEAVTDNATDATAPYRDDAWFAAVGSDYLAWAFEAARAADPDAKLFINDYGTENADKRERYVAIIRDLLDAGVPLDGVGHQMHLNHTRTVDDVEAALDAVAAFGCGPYAADHGTRHLRLQRSGHLLGVGGRMPAELW